MQRFSDMPTGCHRAMPCPPSRSLSLRGRHTGNRFPGSDGSDACDAPNDSNDGVGPNASRGGTGRTSRNASRASKGDGARNASVAVVSPSRGRIPYAEASKVLLRDLVLDAMRDLLLTKDWSSITLADVAKSAGISRQTIYNEFGSRHGLAQGYALRLADRLVGAIGDAIDDNVGDVHGAFIAGFRSFFLQSAADPLVISLLTGAAKPDLLQIITTDSGPIITRASAKLTDAFMHSWVNATEQDAGVLARAIVRLAMSYVSMPPEADHDVAGDLARLMTPFAERYGVMDTS